MNQPDREEVKKIIADSRKGFPLWAKESLAFTIVMAGSVFLVHSYIPALIDSQTKTLAQDTATLKSDLGSTRESVARIDRNIEQLLSKAFDKLIQGSAKPSSGGPGVSKSSQIKNDIELSRGLVRAALTVSHRTDPERLSVATKRMLEEAFRDPSLQSVGWDATKDFIEYRSFLNSFEIAVPPGRGQTTYYWIPKIGSKPIPTAQVLGSVPMEQAALFQQITDPIKQGATGDSLLILTGGVMTLDGVEARHVLISNSEVHYRGDPLRLTDVVFVNCRFVIDPSFNAKQLAMAILDSLRVTLTAG